MNKKYDPKFKQEAVNLALNWALLHKSLLLPYDKGHKIQKKYRWNVKLSETQI